MSEVINGDASLQSVNDGSGRVSVNVENDIEEVIRIDGDASLTLNADGDMSLLTQMDGEGSFFYTESGVSHETYAGPYDVTPRASQQSLSTRNKLMSDDVTIRSIPIYEVSNESGGTTFYIADIGG